MGKGVRGRPSNPQNSTDPRSSVAIRQTTRRKLTTLKRRLEKENKRCLTYDEVVAWLIAESESK